MSVCEIVGGQHWASCVVVPGPSEASSNLCVPGARMWCLMLQLRAVHLIGEGGVRWWRSISSRRGVNFTSSSLSPVSPAPVVYAAPAPGVEYVFSSTAVCAAASENVTASAGHAAAAPVAATTLQRLGAVKM